LKTNLLKYYVAIFYLCSSFDPPPNPGNEDPNPGNLEGSDVPIDHYLGILLAIGIIYVFMIARANAMKKM
jgi:hypothetical protein